MRKIEESRLMNDGAAPLFINVSEPSSRSREKISAVALHSTLLARRVLLSRCSAVSGLPAESAPRRNLQEKSLVSRAWSPLPIPSEQIAKNLSSELSKVDRLSPEISPLPDALAKAISTAKLRFTNIKFIAYCIKGQVIVYMVVYISYYSLYG